jgi:hypothetical protein
VHQFTDKELLCKLHGTVVLGKTSFELCRQSSHSRRISPTLSVGIKVQAGTQLIGHDLVSAGTAEAGRNCRDNRVHRVSRHQRGGASEAEGGNLSATGRLAMKHG